MTDVVVIGAGVSGLTAARRLAEAGLQVVILEASDRVGGRILTVRDGETVVELGAEFIHGRPEVLWDLIAEAGLETYERVGSFLRSQDGGLLSSDSQDGENDPLEQLKSFEGPDCSFTDFLARSGIPQDEWAEQISYIEGFNAADARMASAVALGKQQRAEDAIEGDRMWKVRGGYDLVPAFLKERVIAAGGEIRLAAEVVRVRWNQECEGKQSYVRIATADGQELAAKSCVVTVPLGVLQAGTIEFAPAVPEVIEAAGRMRMGQVCRFTLILGRRLWPESMSFLQAPERTPGIWWTSRPAEENTLTGWVGGPDAASLLRLSTDELREWAIAELAAALSIAETEVRTELRSFQSFNWQADAHFLGAYSWVPVGGLQASAEMCSPLHGILFFAGEHTDTTGHWGTVHAALGSGLRVAAQVLNVHPS